MSQYDYVNSLPNMNSLLMAFGLEFHKCLSEDWRVVLLLVARNPVGNQSMEEELLKDFWYPNEILIRDTFSISIKL